MILTQLEEHGFSVVSVILLFTALVIVISYWTGLFWLNTGFVLIFSAVITLFLRQSWAFSMKIPGMVWFLALLAMGISMYPLLLVTPYYAGSADPLHTINVRVLDDHIPDTYEPYAPSSFSYQLGFHLFAKIFVDLLPFIPDFHVLWLLGVFFTGSLVVALYAATETITRSSEAGKWAAVFLVASKPVFQDFYFGLYPLILGVVFLLLFITLYWRKDVGKYLIFPVLFLVHPSVGLLSLTFLVIHTLFYKEYWKEAIKLAPTLLLVSPAFLFTYSVIAANFFAEKSPLVISNPIMALSELYAPVPLWIGAVPFLSFLFAIYLNGSLKSYGKSDRFLMVLTAASFLLFGLFWALRSITYSKFIELALIGMLIFTGAAWGKRMVSNPLIPRYAMAAIIALGLITFAGSGFFNALWKGDKITPEEAAFALELRTQIPPKSSVLFLSPGGTKMAELSDMIPYHAGRGEFVQFNPTLTRNDAGYRELLQRSVSYDRIVTEECDICITETNTEYVVVQTSYFNRSLNKEPYYTSGNFRLYRN